VRRLLMLSILPLLACGEDRPAGVLGLEAPADGIQLALSPFDVPARSETTVCRYVRLPNENTVDVGRFVSRMLPGSHHFILYRSLLPVAEGQGPCVMDLPRAVVFGAQSVDAEETFPPGVAMRFAPGAMMILESHYVNPADTARRAQVVVNLEYVSADQVEHVADVLFFLNTDLYLPPNSSVTVSKTCPLPDSTSVFLLSSHTHRRGTAFSMDLVDRRTDAVIRHLYDSYNWEDPLIVRFPNDQPLELGSYPGLRFTCSYRNDDSTAVTWGQSSEDEMCIAFGLYYPSRGIRYCF
jgi:hypothetical protein